MDSWFLPTIVALFLYGLWGWFPKIASNYLDAKSAWVWEVLGFAVASLIVFLILGLKPVYHAKGSLFAALTGVAGALGTLFFFIAISRYKASTVTTITALYPVIVVILSFLILKEAISLKQGIGILFAFASIYFLSY